jgi:hypothetical protein
MNHYLEARTCWRHVCHKLLELVAMPVVAIGRVCVVRPRGGVFKSNTHATCGVGFLRLQHWFIHMHDIIGVLDVLTTIIRPYAYNAISSMNNIGSQDTMKGVMGIAIKEAS